MSLSCAQVSILLLTALAVVVCLAGIATPLWLYQEIDNPDESTTKIMVGLYYACAKAPLGDYEDCELIPWDIDELEDDVNLNFKIVRVLFAVTASILISTLIASLCTCCQMTCSNNIMCTSGEAMLSGILGIAGTVTYEFYTPTDYNPFADKFPLWARFDLEKGFAFYFVAAGSGFLLLMGMLGCCTPKRSRHTYVVATTRSPDRGYGNPSYERDLEKRPIAHQEVRRYES